MKKRRKHDRIILLYIDYFAQKTNYEPKSMANFVLVPDGSIFVEISIMIEMWKSMMSLNERGSILKKNRFTKTAAKGVAKVLDSVLYADANSTSCYIIYQPKAPRELEKFRRNRG